MPIIKFSGRNISGRGKEVEYEVLDNGCWRCNSHSHRKQDDRVRITINEKKDYLYRFVYKEYKGDIGDDLLIRHMCNNPYCLNPDHLEIGTHLDNMSDMVTSGNSTKGEKNPRNKNSLSQVSLAKRLINDGEMTLKEISLETGIEHKTLLAIIDGRLWKVEGETLLAKTKGLKYGKTKRDEIKTDLVNGLTYKEIISKHGVSAGFVNVLKKELNSVR